MTITITFSHQVFTWVHLNLSAWLISYCFTLQVIVTMLSNLTAQHYCTFREQNASDIKNVHKFGKCWWHHIPSRYSPPSRRLPERHSLYRLDAFQTNESCTDPGYDVSRAVIFRLASHTCKKLSTTYISTNTLHRKCRTQPWYTSIIIRSNLFILCIKGQCVPFFPRQSALHDGGESWKLGSPLVKYLCHMLSGIMLAL